jgi:hypothetical protein
MIIWYIFSFWFVVPRKIRQLKTLALGLKTLALASGLKTHASAEECREE